MMGVYPGVLVPAYPTSPSDTSDRQRPKVEDTLPYHLIKHTLTSVEQLQLAPAQYQATN